ncbi:uncharacterized protein K460DRAFT_414474 [Cucurbitaria berberidis CBS 394.84]|uniref:Uncharacterized protein n=1 Tax=Cucurbitaria berberidis CBS 394.84 TaxID=1168544 RepID=A0A9P4GK67_9PLEO|nr:uncharacterized protein K460DRAFT_414474 [Cucurbitaria berberidis CBS 394.84]KAF1847803.1 hypothetical protein K460DRAFT_414474 [Cucurbitaria berberidis CBS 394.84]
MSLLTDFELDSLFFDIEEHVTSSSPSKPPTTFHQFTELPPELRNEVYKQYFIEYSSTEPAIKINAQGALVIPPISGSSHQFRTETRGYFTSYLHNGIANSTLQFKAQVRNYDYKPLQARLCALSAELSVPKQHLANRTKVSFIGTFNFNNIVCWVDGYLADSIETPIFGRVEPDLVTLPGLGAVEMFSGSISLVEAIRRYRLEEIESQNSLFWRREALTFLEHASLIGYSTGMREWCGLGEEFNMNNTNEEISTRVFETMAHWHHLLGVGAKMKPGKQRSRMNTHGVDMANVMYAFWCGVMGYR